MEMRRMEFRSMRGPGSGVGQGGEAWQDAGLGLQQLDGALFAREAKDEGVVHQERLVVPT